MQGNLQQRGANSWRIRVFVGRDELGKKRYVQRTVRGTKREAQRAMAKVVTEVDGGRRGERRRVAVAPTERHSSRQPSMPPSSVLLTGLSNIREDDGS